MTERGLPAGWSLCPTCGCGRKEGYDHACRGGVRKAAAPQPVEDGARIGQGVVPRKDSTKKMNKTEARFLEAFLKDKDARYEGLTFRLKANHRYTPDFVVIEDGRPVACYEIKGQYKFFSQGRARLAFDSARTEYPGLKWVWATWQGKEKGWKVEE